MYTKIASTQFEDVNAFVATAIKDMQATRGVPKEKIVSGKTGDGHDYFFNEYRRRRTSRSGNVSLTSSCRAL